MMKKSIDKKSKRRGHF